MTKKNVFSLALSTLLGLGMAMAAPQSQDQPGPPEHERSAGHGRMDPQRQVQMLAKRLNLTADQQKQLLPIITDRQEQMGKIFHDNSLSREDRIAKIRSVREDTDNRIKAVLTDEQKQSYDKLQQQRSERHRGPRNEGSGEGSNNQ